MSFDLRITFTGMCLFVPDGERLHVLMPATGGHGGHGSHRHDHEPAGHMHGNGSDPAGATHPGHGVEDHVVRLYFKSAYLRPGATGVGPELAPAVAMDRRVLDLAGVSAGAIDPSLDGCELVDLEPIVGERISRSLLAPEPVPGGRLVSRVTLAAGRVTGHAPGARWQLTDDGQEVAMTYRVQWTVPVIHPGAAKHGLEWALTNLDGTPAEDLPRLFPVDGVIDVHVYHTPVRELPPGVPQVTRVTQADHFGAFYVLYDNPRARPIPRFRKNPPAEASGVRGPVGADPQTCMSAQSPPVKT